MAEGFPDHDIDTSAPLETPQLVEGTDVQADVGVDTDAAAEAACETSLHDSLPDLSTHRVRMASGGIVRGEVVPAIVFANGMKDIL